jgi:hypothetical protein
MFYSSHAFLSRTRIAFLCSLLVSLSSHIGDTLSDDGEVSRLSADLCAACSTLPQQARGDGALNVEVDFHEEKTMGDSS